LKERERIIENDRCQLEKGRKEREGLYDGLGNKIGGVRKLISILTRMSEEAGR